jgi:hypothetical protein
MVFPVLHRDFQDKAQSHWLLSKESSAALEMLLRKQRNGPWPRVQAMLGLSLRLAPNKGEVYPIWQTNNT